MIEVYYATNRNLEGNNNFGTDFHHDGPDSVRFGWANVAPKNQDDYQVESVWVADEKSTTDPTHGSQKIFERIRRRLQAEQCDLLILIHGFAADFKTALARVAEVSDNYSTYRRPVIGFAFSWPANGRMIPVLDYKDDRRDARLSGQAIARTFYKLRDFLKALKEDQLCKESLNLMVHSMGNWALQNAIDDIFDEYAGRPPRIFDNIFLMAPDVDNDVFEHETKFKLLPKLGKAVHLYYSEDDRALMASEITKLNPDRLGATGPRTLYGLDRKVKLIDCKHVDTPDRTSEADRKRWDLSAHQYYRLRQEVIEDVQQVLAGKLASNIVGRRYLDDDRSFQITPFAWR